MNRGDQYTSADTIDDITKLSGRLAIDLRKSIQAISVQPILTAKWCEVAETFARIAKVSEMEANLPKKTETATLWECEEVAIRYILEDGKLNLCLRILVDFKESERELISTKKYEQLPKEKKESLETFELGAGVVMKNAWEHPEAIQISDINVLMRHIADVLNFALSNPSHMEEILNSNRPELRQEFLVLNYLYFIMKHMDDNFESRIVDNLKQLNILPLASRLLSKYFKRMNHTDVLLAAKTLSAVCDTEDFHTVQEAYLTPSAVAALVELKSDIKDLAKTFEIRKSIRPLLDVLGSLDEDDICGK